MPSSDSSSQAELDQKASEHIARFFKTIESLKQFDEAELCGIVKSLLGEQSNIEICHLGIYYRAVANIETLLTLKSSKDIQAIAMIVRSLFELAVDSGLLGK